MHEVSYMGLHEDVYLSHLVSVEWHWSCVWSVSVVESGASSVLCEFTKDYIIFLLTEASLCQVLLANCDRFQLFPNAFRRLSFSSLFPRLPREFTARSVCVCSIGKVITGCENITCHCACERVGNPKSDRPLPSVIICTHRNACLSRNSIAVLTCVRLIRLSN